MYDLTDKSSNPVNTIIEEINSMMSDGSDLYSIIERADILCNACNITEAKDIEDITSHIRLEVLDTDRFIKVNECREVTNPILFNRPGEPTDDGLLSFSIFGLTQEEKSGLFGYITLHKHFINPICYKAWITTDNTIKPCISKLKTYSLDSKGNIVEDPRGTNGIEFLYKNINKIRFKSSDNGAIRRDIKAKFLEYNRNNMFITKFLVIPIFYRDVNSSKSNKGTVGVSKINQLYQAIIRDSKSIMDTKDYGFDTSGADDLRLQEELLEVYDWFCGTANKNIQKDEAGYGIKGKLGILRMANQSKTSDYAARLVITSSELKANTPNEMRATFERSVIPLAAIIACFAPFVKYCMRRFFEREFAGTEQYPVISKKTGKLEYKVVKDPFVQFSDEVIDVRMEQFIHGYNNRLIPIEVELEDGTIAYMTFKGSYKKAYNEPETIYNRRLTWLDVLFMEATEATQNKMVLITRFPVDKRTNQITTKIDISSTVETEPMYVENQFYPYYPKFKDSDIGKDTSNMFVDSLNMSNLYLPGLGGDYDGDQITVRGVFTDEANDELRDFQLSKKNFIGFGAKNIRFKDGDTVQSLFCLTKILPQDEKKLISPKF